MSEIKFKVTQRKKGRTFTTIHAKTSNPNRHMKLYLNNTTGEVLYPAVVEQIFSGVAITLDSNTKSSCTFPPSIPEEMVNEIVIYLNTFHEVVAAARKLIKEEQKRISEVE